MTTNTVRNSDAVLPKRGMPFKRDSARRIDRVIDYFGALPKRDDHPRIRRRRIGSATSEVDER